MYFLMTILIHIRFLLFYSFDIWYKSSIVYIDFIIDKKNLLFTLPEGLNMENWKEIRKFIENFSNMNPVIVLFVSLIISSKSLSSTTKPFTCLLIGNGRLSDGSLLSPSSPGFFFFFSFRFWFFFVN